MSSLAILDTPLTFDDKQISLRSPNHGDIQALNSIFTCRHIIETDPGNEGWAGREGQFVSVVRERAESEPPTLALFLITSKQHNDKVIGFSGFGKIVKEDSWGLVGYVGIQVLPEFTRKGVGSEALIMSIGYGFSKLGMDSITIATFHDNEGMKKIVEKLKTKGIWKPEKERVDVRYKTLESGKIDVLYTISKTEWKQE
jgi:RimJ/RimL family protein N-acetyltransferase